MLMNISKKSLLNHRRVALECCWCVSREFVGTMPSPPKHIGAALLILKAPHTCIAMHHAMFAIMHQYSTYAANAYTIELFVS
jgi:hypothetical protein